MVKYTETVLREAVAASRNMSAVLRYLGLAPSGGSHAHLRRRIDALGIATSHFLRRSAAPGPSRRRLHPAEILVLSGEPRRRTRPDLLRRALAESGVPQRCAECGVDPVWNGRPLTLHVDHRNGSYWDCRLDNLRLLCPNCHSQTDTYAGRNRRVFGVRPGQLSHPFAADGRQPVDEARLIELIGRIDRREATVADVSRLIGCSPAYFHRVRARIERAGSLGTRPGGRRWRAAAHRETVIAYALAHPEFGPKTLARRLRELGPDGCALSHGTVSTILREAGLNTVAARRSRLVPPAEVVE